MTDEAPKKKGRPKGSGKYKPGKVEINTDYLENHPQKLLEAMSAGYLDCEIFALFGICRDTYYQWCKDHPEFKKAHEIGLSYCQAYYARHARTSMDKGDDRGFRYFTAIMANKFGWGKETTTSQAAITNNTINVQGDIKVLNSQSTDQLKELLKADLKFLTQRNVMDVEIIEHTDGNDQPN